jgi:hypothetical protein
VTPSDVQLNSAWFRDSVNNAQNTQVRIQIKMPDRKPDESLQAVIARLEQNEPVANNLRNLNPKLLDVVRGRAQQNLAQLLVFKSCDRGVSWTTDAGCTTNTASFRTRDQNGDEVGLGWRPAFTVNFDSITGRLSSYVISDNVPSGREYLYVFVTKTRGLFDVEVTTELTQDASGRVLSRSTD